MQTLPYMGATLVVGALISAQPAMNALLARAVGSAFGAALISHLVAFAAIALLALAAGWGSLSRGTLSTVPWWVFLAGVIGVSFVASGIVVTPVTGALVYFLCIIGGQLIGSALIDHFGAFGLEERGITWRRMAGIGLVVVGALLAATADGRRA